VPFEQVRRGISQGSDESPPLRSIEAANYILLHINNIMEYGDREPDTPFMDQLDRDFRPVVAIRPRQSGMEVAWVCKRRRAEASPALRR